MIRRMISFSRYLIIIPSFGSFITAIILLVYGTIETINLATKSFTSISLDKGSKIIALAAIEVIDLYLLGTVFFMIALGLYELFIDENIILPDWLNIHNFDQLKSKLIGVIVVIMGVIFLSQLVGWDGQRNLLGFGAGIALVIAALTLYLSYKKE